MEGKKKIDSSIKKRAAVCLGGSGGGGAETPGARGSQHGATEAC